MYIPLLKCRKAELDVAETVCKYFSDDMIPLFEVFSDIYEKKYQTDPNTHEYVYIIKNGRRQRIKLSPTDEDIITLRYINNKIDNKIAFIDFLRVDENKYKRFDVNKVSLGLKIRRFNDYRKRLLEVSQYNNFIPVISIRNAFGNSLNSMASLYDELKVLSNNVAIRITADVIDEYMPLLYSLRNTDYVLFDIEETDVKSLSFEIQSIISDNIKAKKIILNSPRSATYQNKDFEEAGKTAIIDNIILKKYKELGFAGFGDYAGYKDVLPAEGLASRGAALALIYNYDDNAFWVFTNKNTSLGVKGYAEIKPKVMNKRGLLDPDHTCLAYKKLELVENGTYATWIMICLIRYIEQLNKNISDWNE